MLLQQARKSKKMTQVDLAEQAGTTSAVISYLEAGQRFPIAKIRENIERVLGKKIDWIGTRLQGVIGSGYGENETPEDRVVKAIYEFIKSAQRHETGYRFQFLRRMIKELEKAQK